ncbi:MAG: hypothetical protein ACKOPM_07185 [Novosphingobium sp.]
MLAGPDPEPVLSDISPNEPSRSVARALIYGCLAGISAALAALLVVAGGVEFPLIDALLAGEIGEFFAGILILAVYIAFAVLVGLFVAMPTAFPFVAMMARFELRTAMLQKVWVWGLLGAGFAIPLGLWMAWPSSQYESDIPAQWNLVFFNLNLGSGFVGGIAAWFGYYRPIKSDP